MNRRFVLVFPLILFLGLSVGASTSQAIGISIVAKFDITKVSDYLRTFLDEGNATLTLTGGTTVGGDFSGSDTVRIIDQGGKRDK